MSGSIQHSIEAQRFTAERSSTNGSSAAYSLTDDAVDHSPTLARSNSDYTVTVSEDAQALYQQDQTPSSDSDIESTPTDSEPTGQTTPTEETSDQGLTEEEQQEVDDLKARDEEVRIHEQAHASTGGQYAGSPSYSYEQGPDGQRYVTDGEVQIDVSPVANDPQATIDKMRQVYRAALAPAEPSSADRSVANTAQQQMSEAMADLAQASKGDETNQTSATTTSQSRSVLESSYNAINHTNRPGGNVDLVA